MAIQKTHTGFISNFLASLLFLLPSIYFYFKNLILAMFIYGAVLVFVLINSLSNTKYNMEIAGEEWVNFFDWVDFKKAIKGLFSKKYLNSK